MDFYCTVLALLKTVYGHMETFWTGKAMLPRDNKGTSPNLVTPGRIHVIFTYVAPQVMLITEI